MLWIKIICPCTIDPFFYDNIWRKCKLGRNYTKIERKHQLQQYQIQSFFGVSFVPPYFLFVTGRRPGKDDKDDEDQ